MKKILSTVAALGLVAGIATSAAALELKIKGDYTVDGFYIDNHFGLNVEHVLHPGIRIGVSGTRIGGQLKALASKTVIGGSAHALVNIETINGIIAFDLKFQRCSACCNAG
ncbi:MAG: hypothetical protein KJ985_05510, partial [Proteobacteria bacterium]|nr:hypothetical protein [Pseudomonadota bacterium]